MKTYTSPRRLPLGVAPSETPEGGPLGTALMSPPVAPQSVEEPFVFGRGGKRMTPAEITIAREMAKGQMIAGSDFSPVQSWTQGAARASQAIIGALTNKRAVRAAEANTAEDAQMMEMLSSSDVGDDAVAKALLNPYASEQVRTYAGKVQDRRYEAGKPEYFTAGNDRVMFDPRSKQSTVLHDGQSDAEEYAEVLGFLPGTQEYNEAMQDYVLRGHGPTAYELDVDLEGVRQGNRERQEGIRQGNRLSLRGTPTYRQANPAPPKPPRPRSGSGGGGNAAKPAPSTVAGQTATDPKTGRKVRWDGKAWVPAG